MHESVYDAAARVQRQIAVSAPVVATAAHTLRIVQSSPAIWDAATRAALVVNQARRVQSSSVIASAAAVRTLPAFAFVFHHRDRAPLGVAALYHSMRRTQR